MGTLSGANILHKLQLQLPSPPAPLPRQQLKKKGQRQEPWRMEPQHLKVWQSEDGMEPWRMSQVPREEVRENIPFILYDDGDTTTTTKRAKKKTN